MTSSTDNLLRKLRNARISQKSPATINLFMVRPTNVYRYRVTFTSNLDVRAAATFLRRHFLKIERAYVYDNNYVYTLERLVGSNLEGTLFNRKTQDNVVMTMVYVDEREIDAEFVDKFMANACGSISVGEIQSLCDSDVKIVPEYVYSVHDGIAVCINCRYYEVERESIADVISRYKELYKERFRQALDFFLNKVYIYCDIDGKIYRYKEINWETDLIVIESLGKGVAFDRLHRAETSPFTEPSESLRGNLKRLISDGRFGLAVSEFTTVVERVLPEQTVTFGDGVSCKCIGWERQVRSNEVFSAIELCCWVLVHEAKDERLARSCVETMQEIQEDTGVRIGNPIYLSIEEDGKSDYINVLSSIGSNEVQLVLVIVNESVNKPKALIKHLCFVKHSLLCHIVSSKHVQNRNEIYDVILRVNAKLGGCLWSVSLPRYKLICALDTYVGFDRRTPAVCSFVANLGDDVPQWYSKSVFHEGPIRECFVDIVHKYRETNGYLPTEIVIYHSNNGLEGAQIEAVYKLLQFESITLTVVYVSDRPGIRIFKDGTVSPGTIIKDVINGGCSNFALMSNAATPVAVHYAVVVHNGISSVGDLQELTYKLCYVYYKKMEVSEMPAPCLYARKLSKLITEKVYAIPSSALDMYLYYL